MLRRLHALLLPAILLLLFSAPARAEGTRVAAAPPFYADVQFFTVTGVGGFNDRQIDGSTPFAIADMRLRGEGVLAGAGFRTLLSDRTWRGGMSVAIFGVPGLSLTHAPIGPDLSLSLHAPWGATAEVYGGRFFHFGPIAPYVDLRLGATFARVSVDVRSVMFGDVQTIERSLTTPLIAPRVGALIPLGHGFSFDVSGSATPVGLERASLNLGLTYHPEEEKPQASRNKSH